VSNFTPANGLVQQFVNTSSHYLVTRGATGPHAINQAYGLAANLMTQQAAILAFMDRFDLSGRVVLAGLLLKFIIRRF
jgi:hypothetical protein